MELGLLSKIFLKIAEHNFDHCKAINYNGHFSFFIF